MILAKKSTHGAAPAGETVADVGPSDKCRVLVVDDHPLTRGGFARLFESLNGFELCGEAATVNDAVALCEETKPGLVVLDLGLGDEQGLEVLRRLATVSNGPRVLVASMLDDVVYGRAALELGAHGFVSKDSGVAAIVAAAETLRQGGLVIPPRLRAAVTGARGANSARGPALWKSPLSAAARDLLSALGGAETLEQLATERHVSLGTLHTQLYRLRKRLSMESLTQLRTYSSLYRAHLAGGTAAIRVRQPPEA